VHRSSPWAATVSKKPSHRRTRTETSTSTRPSKLRTSSFQRSGEDCIPRLGLAAALPKPRLLTEGHVVTAEDWRLDIITIENIDMETRPVAEPLRPIGTSLTQSSPADSTSVGGSTTRAKFFPADPKSTDMGWGVVHLYRDAQETPRLYEEAYNSSGSDVDIDDTTPFNKDECTTLCILAVPSYMMPSDLLGWVGEQAREDVSHFRLVRTGKINRYMVLMKFRDATRARAWHKEYNGRLFNSMDPEFGHVVFVKSITFQIGHDIQQPSSFPNMSNDPFIPKTQPTTKSTATSPAESSSLATTLSTKPPAPPTSSLVELPTCPVCLERMDETTGLLTILCQHVFHCACLEKWRGSGCPVCRYTQNSSIPGAMRSPGSTEDAGNACSTCGAEQNLWICLICGNVGCGRYDSAHAFAHYESTAHSYAMDISTQHVWDYAGDGYVHRLIQNKADGKLVDLPGASSGDAKGVNGGMAAYGADMVPREKMESMGTEYAYLLQSQLENQRSYFQDQLERAVEKACKASASAERSAAILDAMTQKLSDLQTQHSEALTTIKNLERNLERTSKKAEKAENLAKKLAKDWREEKTMNEALSEKIRFLDGRVKESEMKCEQLKAEKADLEEQNRDLSFFISGGEKLKELKEAGEDVDGQIEVGTSKRKKGKGKK
jgi:BRCA1-associated protein